MTTYTITHRFAKTTNTRRNLLRRAANLVVVDDGSERWVGSRREVYGWLASHGFSRGYHSGYRTSNSVGMDSEQYQSLCDETRCITGTGGSAGDYAGDPHELIDAITERGAVLLYIH